MRERRIWLIIAVILAAGILITLYTNTLIKDKESQITESQPWVQLEPAQNTGVQAGSSAQALASSQAGALARSAPAAVPQSQEQEAVQETQEESYGPASPLEGVAGRSASVLADGGTDYRQRLEELDRQISRQREQDQDSNAYSLRNAAQAELRLWEGEMELVYAALLDESSQEEQEVLSSQQSQWLKDRESRAVQSASQNEAPLMESVEYTAALVSLTRERAYELVGQYEERMEGPEIG